MSLRKATTRILCLIGLQASAQAVRADFVTVDFSSSANAHLQDTGFNHGIGLPDAKTGSIVLGGVPFSIPTAGNNYWNATFAAGPNPRVLTIPTNIASATEVDTLINTYGGIAGPNSYAYVEFIGTGGAHFRKDLVGNEDIRDFNNFVFTNSINGTTTTQVLSYQPAGFTTVGRLDKQRFTLPVDFLGQTLTTIRLVDNGFDPPNAQQRTFLVGVSVIAVPEPSSTIMLGLGALGLLAFDRGRRGRRGGVSRGV